MTAEARTALPVPRPRTGRLVIASVPANHVYVRHLAPEDGSGPVRLPDPTPPGAAATQQWWPPVMLDAAWVEAHDFDVFHLHFGFDARSPADLEELVAALRRRGKPLVFTVHDLRNPHHLDREAHDRHLDVLVPAADVLITLTQGAAAEIRARWGREAVVVPHPHVVPLDVMRRAAARREVLRRGPRDRTLRVGLHVKSLRAGMHPHPLLPVLVDAVRDLPGAVLQVNGHRDVLLPDGPRYDAGLAEALQHHAARGEVDLRIHDFLDDDALWAYLADLDVSVLPYRFGTHSGWLEACRDLGTAVIAPSCGYYADQGPVLTYEHDEDHFDAASLVAAVREVHAAARRSPDRRGRTTSTAGRRSPPPTPGCTTPWWVVRGEDLPHRLQPLPHPRALRRRPGVDDLDDRARPGRARARRDALRRARARTRRCRCAACRCRRSRSAPPRWPTSSRPDRAGWPSTTPTSSLMLSLARTGAEEYDVVHNNSLHHLPIAMAPAVDVPMLTTLHTPPLPMIESALALCSRPPRFVAVSEWTANAWRHAVDSDVVLNGLDLRDWPAGPGGGPGRVVGPDRPGEGAAPGDRGLPDRGRAARAGRARAGPGLLRPRRWRRCWATTPATPGTSPSATCPRSCGGRRWRW